MASYVAALSSMLVAMTYAAHTMAPPFQCPASFQNVVFNNFATDKSSVGISQLWNTNNDHGMNNWIGFLNNTLVAQPTYKGKVLPLELMRHNEPRIVNSPPYVQQAVNLLQSNDAPDFLELFNEPDLGPGHTPVTGPREAARSLAPLLDKAPWPKTGFVSPALADSSDFGWWDTFDDECNGCLQKIPIIGVHLYDRNSSNWIRRMGEIARQWRKRDPTKDLWITEMAPATKSLAVAEPFPKVGCRKNHEAMQGWMTDVVRALRTDSTFDNVKRMYWNAGEWSPFFDGDDEDLCNHSLTRPNGDATALLTHYSSLCS